MPQAVPSPGDGHRGGAVPAGAAVPVAMAQRDMAQPPARPPCRCTHLVSFRPQDAGGSLQEEGGGQGCFRETTVCPGNATPHPPAQPPAVARDRPSPKRDRQLSQTPLRAWARSPSLLQPSSPNPEPRNPSLTPGFGSGLTVLTGVPGDPPGPGAPELPWSQRRESLSPAREKATALGTPQHPSPPGRDSWPPPRPTPSPGPPSWGLPSRRHREPTLTQRQRIRLQPGIPGTTHCLPRRAALGRTGGRPGPLSPPLTFSPFGPGGPPGSP